MGRGPSSKVRATRKMNGEIKQLLTQFEYSKNISRELLLDILKKAIMTAAKKKFGEEGGAARVEYVEETGDFQVFCPRRVVAEVTDKNCEVLLKEARRHKKRAKVGDEIEVEVPATSLGRIATQTAKQVIVQRLRGEERESTYKAFQDKKGQVVSGTVFRNEHRQVIMSLEGAEAVLPYEEQMRSESYISGDRLKVYILDVKRTTRGPKIVVSRSHPSLIKGLFQLEVPEVDDEVVVIKHIARAPGERTKIALESMDENVDPVGACVGIRGTRVQAIVRELNNEKIDIIKWAEDTTEFITNAMNPARLEQIILSEKEKRAVVVVATDQLSLAIGKRGQNAKLAAKLTGWHIDIKNQEDYLQEQKAKAEKLLSQVVGPPLSELKGVGKAMLGKLEVAGYKSVSDLRGVDAEKLSQVPGLGAKTAAKLLEQAAGLLEAADGNGGGAEEDAEAETEESSRVEAGQSLSELKGVGKAMLGKLEAAGYKNVSDLKGVDAETLSRVPGLGAKTAAKLLERVADHAPVPAQEEASTVEVPAAAENTAAETQDQAKDETDEREETEAVADEAASETEEQTGEPEETAASSEESEPVAAETVADEAEDSAAAEDEEEKE